MAAEVLSKDHSNADGSCETLRSDAIVAGMPGGENGQDKLEMTDDNGIKKKARNHHHHHRRKPSKKKRKWKPYSKMTWEEKKACEEREELRADRIRGEMFDRGRPVAPYNTTQFIMAEHDPYEADELDYSDLRKSSDLNNDACSNKSSTSGAYSAQLNAVGSPQNNDDLLEPNYTDSPHMAPEFISQDFCEAYERVQEESLSTMTRDDLVREHMTLERTLSFLQNQLADEKSLNNSFSVKMQSIEEQLEILVADNKRLVRENLCLRYGEDDVKVREMDAVADAYVFQTSDYDYEAPNNETENVGESSCDKDLVERSMDSLNNNNSNNNDDVDVGETKSESQMSVASKSGTAAGGEIPAKQESSYEADQASSSDEEGHTSTARNMKKKRRSHKARDRQKKQRSAGSVSPASDNEDPREDSKKTESRDPIMDPATKNVETPVGEDSPTVARSPDNKAFANTGENPTARGGAKADSCADAMDAESYSWEDRGAATVSMESLTSGEN